MKKCFFSEPDMFREARVGKGGKGRTLIIEILIFLAVFFVASIVESLPLVGVAIGQVIELVRSGDLTDALPLELTVSGTLTLFATALMTVSVCIFCRYIQERPLRSTGLRKEHAVREYVLGAVIGIVMISFAVLLGAVTGLYELRFSGVSLGTFLLYTLGYMLQGMSEEMLCRGYFMTSIARRYPAWLALLVSSVVFAMLHLGNPGVNLLAVINLILVGLVFGVYVLRRGDLWGACAMHSFWNLFQGNFFGISVSGTTDGSSTLFSALAREGSELWTGGEFGIESGLLTTVVQLIALAIILFVLPDRADTHTPAPAPELPVNAENAPDAPEASFPEAE